MPERLQRPRVKGWRTPAGAVYVGLPTLFGNPFAPKIIPGWATMSREYAADDYRNWLSHPHGTRRRGGTGELMCWCLKHGDRDQVLAHITKLRGLDLVCWCPVGQPCHGDVLLQLANTNSAKET